MSRLSVSLLLSLLLVHLLTPATSVQIHPVCHDLSPAHAVGQFTAGQSLGAQCPSSIQHTVSPTTTNLIPHSTIYMNARQCNDGNVTTIISLSKARQLFPDGTRHSILDLVSSTSSPALYAVDHHGRVCGPSATDRLGRGTLIVIVQPLRTLHLGISSLFPTFRYMIVDDPAVAGLCVYKAPAPSPSPSVSPSLGASRSSTPTPSTSISASTSASPSLLELPAASPSPSLSVGASPSPSASPSASLSVGASPSPSASISASISASLSAAPAAASDDDASPSPASQNTGSGSQANVTSQDDDTSSCFPADATVQLSDGSVTRMSALVVGDRVMVGPAESSDVFMFTHREHNGKYAFVTMHTAMGVELSATAGHYLYVNGRLAMASSVKQGDILQLGNGTMTAVESVKMTWRTGLFNPQTVHGDIVVNGVRASTFTKTVRPAVAQVMLSPLRLSYSVIGAWTGLFEGGVSKFVTDMLPSGQISV